MPTIKDVAKKAGVSVATASYAINGDERIKPETRQKVIDAAIELHYIPNGSAKNLKRQKSNIVLVFVSSFGGPIYQEILSYLDEKLLKLDYRMIICNGSLSSYESIDPCINPIFLFPSLIAIRVASYIGSAPGIGSETKRLHS